MRQDTITIEGVACLDEKGKNDDIRRHWFKTFLVGSIQVSGYRIY